MALACAQIRKNQDATANRWHYKERQKMTIDFKGVFRNKKPRATKNQ
jgi:hypothetical protein